MRCVFSAERTVTCVNRFGGADGIVPRSLKKTEERPLNALGYCHLLIPLMSLENPFGFFGHPHNASFWQQLATVSSEVVWGTAGESPFPRSPFLANFRVVADIALPATAIG